MEATMVKLSSSMPRIVAAVFCWIWCGCSSKWDEHNERAKKATTTTTATTFTTPYTWTSTKTRKHSITCVRLFDSTVVAVLCFRNLVAPVVWCCFYLPPFMGVISSTIYQHRKLCAKTKRWANGLVNAYVQLSQSTLASSSSNSNGKCISKYKFCWHYFCPRVYERFVVVLVKDVMRFGLAKRKFGYRRFWVR